MYVVIADDPQATLEIFREKPTYDGVLAELRNMGKNHVRANRALGVMGWVSDVGSIMPEFNRNVVASCLMQAIGARPYLLGGPLVITGYEYPEPGEEEMGYPEPMSEPQLKVVVGLYVAVLTALGMEVSPGLEKYRVDRLRDLQWEAQVQRDAQEFREAGKPGLTIGGVAGQHSPAGAAAAILLLMDQWRSTPAATVLTMKTANPEAMMLALGQLPRVTVTLVDGSHDEQAGTCKVRVTGDVGFLKFACAQQGYATVVAEEPEAG